MWILGGCRGTWKVLFFLFCLLVHLFHSSIGYLYTNTTLSWFLFFSVLPRCVGTNYIPQEARLLKGIHFCFQRTEYLQINDSSFLFWKILTTLFVRSRPVTTFLLWPILHIMSTFKGKDIFKEHILTNFSLGIHTHLAISRFKFAELNLFCLYTLWYYSFLLGSAWMSPPLLCYTLTMSPPKLSHYFIFSPSSEHIEDTPRQTWL